MARSSTKKTTHKHAANTRHDDEAIVYLPHHRKPFRIRHLSALVLLFVLLLALVLEIGLVVGKTSYSTAPDVSTPTSPFRSTLSVVRSNLGYSFSYDSNLFNAEATLVNDKGVAQAASNDQLRDNQQLSLVTLKPKRGAVAARELSAQFSVQVSQDAKALANLKQKPGNATMSNNELAAQYYALTSTNDFDVTVSSATDTSLNGVLVRKTVYQYVPKFNGGTSYAVVWAGVVHDRPFAVKLQGLLGSSEVPESLQPVFDSLTIDASQKVEGLSTIFGASSTGMTLDTKYVADSVSPAVVKIYNLVCGNLVLEGQQLTDNLCDGVTGSGFLVSSDGYIATNGHVATLTANDELVNLIVSDPNGLSGFLQYIGLTAAQANDVASDPAKAAAIVSKIYDLTPDQLKFGNEKRALLVSFGDKPVTLKANTDIPKAIDQSDTDYIKHAQLIGANYSAKDLFNIGTGLTSGFKGSDVALLKTDISNAPLIQTVSSGIIQNQKITILGFPGDAENELVSSDKVDVSVTDGSISAIKEAAGNTGKLYQSDADASHGNSGGPAITDDGKAFGLLTYRYSGDAQGNAAKSYIRDIADFNKLASDKGISFDTKSTTQTDWVKGLDLYSKNHFSAAIKQFNEVKKLYPAHRLADSYIANAQAAIKAGKDVSTVPVALLAGIAVVVIVAIGATVIIIVRHHGKHKAFIAMQGYAMPGATAANGTSYTGSIMPQAQSQQVAAPIPAAGYTATPIVQPQTIQPSPAPAAPAQPVVISPNQQNPTNQP